MSVPARPTIVVADDHTTAASLMLDLVRQAYNGIAIADSIESLRALLEERQPDIAIVDVQMHNGLNILDVIVQLQQISPPTRFILGTGHPGWAPVGRALALGVWGYLVKPASAEEVHEAIDIVSRGRRYLTRAQALRGEARILSPRRPLSPGQVRVFNRLRMEWWQKRIAKELDRSLSTVSNQVSAIRARFGISTEPAYTDWENFACPCIDDFDP